jgi:hypothetical protein
LTAKQVLIPSRYVVMAYLPGLCTAALGRT